MCELNNNEMTLTKRKEIANYQLRVSEIKEIVGVIKAYMKRQMYADELLELDKLGGMNWIKEVI